MRHRWQVVFGLLWLGVFVGYWSYRAVGPAGWAAPVVLWLALAWVLRARQR